jgi:hypothetical protein
MFHLGISILPRPFDRFAGLRGYRISIAMQKRFVGALIFLTIPVLASAQSEDARLREAATKGVAAIQKAQSTWYTANKQVCA